MQTCIVHLIRASLDYASLEGPQGPGTAPDLHRAKCGSGSTERVCHGAWGAKFPTVVASWRRAWTQVIPFFTIPPEVRRIIYTINAIESVHVRLRKIIKTRGHFPSDDVATKLIWLVLRNITAWSRATLALKRR